MHDSHFPTRDLHFHTFVQGPAARLTSSNDPKLFYVRGREGNAEWIEETDDGRRGGEEMMMGKKAGQNISLLGKILVTFQMHPKNRVLTSGVMIIVIIRQ